MSTPIYISRNFTEFGAFTVAEVLDFQKRGILLDSDYARIDGSGEWIPIPAWVASAPASAPDPAPEPVTAPVATAPKAAKPKAAPKEKATAKAPAAAPKAKKAAKKAATPAAD